MHRTQLGIAPIIPVIVKAIPAIVGIFTGKKKEKAAERMAQYQANEQEILSGRAVMATDVMTESDMAFLRSVWPRIHVAARWTDINWAATGFPQGPQLTPAAIAAIQHVWPAVHSAAAFGDINWQYHAVPVDLVASLLPLPELGYQQPATASQAARASLIPAGLGPEVVLTLAAVGVLGLIIFSDRR